MTPTKDISTFAELLTVGAKVLAMLDRPMSSAEFWRAYDCSPFKQDTHPRCVLLGLSFLYSIGAIEYTDGMFKGERKTLAEILLERDAAEIVSRIIELRRLINCDRGLLRDLGSAISDISDANTPDYDTLRDMYREAGILLPDNVKPSYDAVKSFSVSVVRARREYLSTEISDVRLRINQREHDLSILDKEHSRVIDMLDNKAGKEAPNE